MQFFEYIQIIQNKLLEEISLDFRRDIYFEIDRNDRLIGIFWERWIWKTYLLLQRLKEIWEGVYILADLPMVKDIGLFQVVFQIWREYWIKYFYIDEIHKISDWQSHIKAIFDSISDIKLVFTGSNSLQLYRWIVDLWRRVMFYQMSWLSFKEFLRFKGLEIVSKFSFDDVMNNYKRLSMKLSDKIKFVDFHSYLKSWYYIFGINEDFWKFVLRLNTTLEKVIVEDLVVFKVFKTISLEKLKKLFYFIANIPPSDLNISSLASKIWVDNVTLENVLYILDKIGLVFLIPKYWNVSDRVRKQYKILLWNPNIYYVYNLNPDIWTVRESFFVNMLRRIKDIEIFVWKKFDFIVKYKDKEYYFETGGKSKKKIKYSDNVFVVKDDILIAAERQIPLWLFWFLSD